MAARKKNPSKYASTTEDKMSALRKRNIGTLTAGNGTIRTTSSQKFENGNVHHEPRYKDQALKLHLLLQKGRKINIKDNEMCRLITISRTNKNMLQTLPKFFHSLRKKHLKLRRFLNTALRKKLFKLCILSLCVLLLVCAIFYTVVFLRTSTCLVSSSSWTDEIFRPRMPCSICRNLEVVPELLTVNKQELRYKYAFTPLVIRGAALEMATNITYEELKFGFNMAPSVLEDLENYCQFFPYDTEFRSIREVFNMSEERAGFLTGEKPWYIGWCNCVATSRHIARQLYHPRFLPGLNTVEDYNWIFMGGPGHGAGLHIDIVNLPSWQAQLSGRKRWHLVPSYECESVCKPLEVVVNTGDVIILDTNAWFHATEILPGGISITVGAEFE